MGARTNAGRRVLIVDDDADSAEGLRMMLQLSGHSVETASTGTAALELARAFHPDVILCDLGLPGMDGFEVAASMRADPVLRSTRLVALTGYGQPEDIDRTSAAGFNAHVTKPSDPDELIRMVDDQ
jgi:CheY-like chemotaxis protein